MTSAEKKALVKEIVEKVQSILSDVKTVKDFSVKSTRTLIGVAELIVSFVEQYGGLRKLSGTEKKALAVDVLNEFINIKVKFVPRKLMDKIEGYVIGLVIETIVSVLNKKLGKAWLQG